jgi:formylglycine-generating enzyme required for sulfatase activity
MKIIIRKLIFLLLLTWTLPVFANNLTVSNVSLQNQDVVNATVEVKFDITWENSFSGTDGNGASFNDCAWVFVKYWVVGVDDETTGWHHATLTSGGSVTPTSDGMGAFVNIGTLQTVKWAYGADGVAANATIRIRVCGLEMVYIPQGAFVYNVAGVGGSNFNNFGGGAQVTVDQITDVPAGASSGWPNGYNAFYLAKYEVSQGQYADFLNMLSATDAANRFGAYGDYEHTITYTSGNPYGSRYTASAPNRASARISWDDAKAYASWAGLRPMTEMEFEKAARGGGSNTNTYPWGDTNPSSSNSLYLPSGHSSPYDAWKYYANFYDNSDNADIYDGPTNVGNYLSGDIARTNEQTGASPYGVADLAGNVWEHLINCAWATIPENGSGALTPPSSWPGASSGKGLRGGSWGDATSGLRVSVRSNAAWTYTYRDSVVGFRPARTP